jgi:hypothetical protein
VAEVPGDVGGIGPDAGLPVGGRHGPSLGATLSAAGPTQHRRAPPRC